MENDDLLNDDFLRNLVRNTKLEEPSGDFVENVMTRIQPGVEIATAKKPFYLFLKSAWLYVVLAAALVVFLITSDIPVMDYFPGKEYFTQTLIPYFDNVFSGFKNLFEHSKFTNIGLMVVAAGGLLYILDFLFSRRAHTQHHYTS